MTVKFAIVPTEPELGPQRRCTGCGEWWPADAEFYYVRHNRGGRLHSWCRACRNERAQQHRRRSAS